MLSKKAVALTCITEEERSRFWSYVERLDGDKCRSWLRAINDRGYGIFGLGAGHYKTIVRAHRIAFYCHNGGMDHDLEVMHSCNNPKCCNPAHLSQGTHLCNMRYMKACGRSHGRGPSGTGHPLAKLSDGDVVQIRARVSNGETGVSLAKEFGVSDALISKVKLGKAWKHVS